MPTTLSKSGNVQNGLVYGAIIGLVYCISIFLRFNMISSGPIMVGIITLVFYLGVIGLLFACALKRRKDLGGFIDLKNAFQTVFIAILLAELIYLIFTYFYLKFIDPNYFDKFYASMETFFEKSNMKESAREEALDKMKSQFETQKLKGTTIQGLLLSYVIWVCITGVFGFIVSLIVRKNRPVFESDNSLAGDEQIIK